PAGERSTSAASRVRGAEEGSRQEAAGGRTTRVRGVRERKSPGRCCADAPGHPEEKPLPLPPPASGRGFRKTLPYPSHRWEGVQKEEGPLPSVFRVARRVAESRRLLSAYFPRSGG